MACSSGIDIYNDTLPTVPSLHISNTKVLFLGVKASQKKAFRKNPQVERMEFTGITTASIEAGAFEGLSQELGDVWHQPDITSCWIYINLSHFT